MSQAMPCRGAGALIRRDHASFTVPPRSPTCATLTGGARAHGRATGFPRRSPQSVLDQQPGNDVDSRTERAGCVPSRVAIAVADRLLCGLCQRSGRLRRGRWPGAIGPVGAPFPDEGHGRSGRAGHFAAWLVSVLSKDYALTTRV